MSDDLTTWLRKQITARRDVAIAALDGTDGHWWRREAGAFEERTREPVGNLFAGEPCFDEDGDNMGGSDVVVYDEGSPSDARFEHIAANDPRDTIARCDAELAVLDLHSINDAGLYEKSPDCAHCAVESYPCRTVRMIGSGYRFRDGYREEWKL